MYVASNGKKINRYMVLVGKLEGERPLRRFMCKTEYAIQLDL
jgi:hypothetical protein